MKELVNLVDQERRPDYERTDRTPQNEFKKWASDKTSGAPRPLYEAVRIADEKEETRKKQDRGATPQASNPGTFGLRDRLRR